MYKLVRENQSLKNPNVDAGSSRSLLVPSQVTLCTYLFICITEEGFAHRYDYT